MIPTVTEEEIPTQEEIEEVRKWYTPVPIPRCRVCRAELEIHSASGGRPTVYVCSKVYESGSRSQQLEHFALSKFDRHQKGDERVIKLIGYIKILERIARERGTL